MAHSASRVRSRRSILASALLAPLAAMARDANQKELHLLMEELPDYRPVGPLSGALQLGGVDQLNNIVTLWLEAFQKHYPKVKGEILGKGSGTPLGFLLGHPSGLSMNSREFRPDEVATLQAKRGVAPTLATIAYDGQGVYVHRNNPIAALSLAEVDAIFSSTRNLGSPWDFTTWGQLGLPGAWADRPIRPQGRNAAAHAYAYFKETVLHKGDFKDAVREQPGTAAVVSAVGADLGAIGYAGFAYQSDAVRLVPLSTAAKPNPVAPTLENIHRGDYPLSRPLYLGALYDPERPREPLRAEFLRLVFSKPGQQIVMRDGWLPLTPRLARDQLQKLGLLPGER